ncbi:MULTISPECIES: hypothetical protein [Olivibacter]|uniref:HTTM-like domain-containing protein n=1 Tax=Olivibacter jilunii TaxID=985016 RepID=A0ABW6B931_9SPHI|nr:hypothetical protein [Pseudosphingobacterium sp.]
MSWQASGYHSKLAQRILAIGSGTLLFISMLSIWNDLPLLYGADALFPSELLYFRNDFELGVGLQLWSTSAYAVKALGLLYLVLCVLFCCNIGGRYTSLVLLLLHLSFFRGTVFFTYGFDQLATIALFYYMMLPLNGTLWMFRMHLCLIYYFAGLDKMLGPTWWNGEALYKALTLPYGHQALLPLFQYLAQWPLLYKISGIGIWASELIYPLFSYIKDGRYALWYAITLHLLIAWLMQLHLFSGLMLVLNLAAWPPKILYRMLHIHSDLLNKAIAQLWNKIKRKEAIDKNYN